MPECPGPHNPESDPLVENIQLIMEKNRMENSNISTEKTPGELLVEEADIALQRVYLNRTKGHLKRALKSLGIVKEHSTNQVWVNLQIVKIRRVLNDLSSRIDAL